MKWNMGWMHDTLHYFQRDPVFRKYHQHDLTFAMVYHYHENFVLPLSHDEVVHGKGSLIGKMVGDEWQQFANLRSLLAFQWAFPGKKLLMMGCEFGQKSEWNANASVDWWLLQEGPFHRGIQTLVADLNRFYKNDPALFEADYQHHGFYWLDCGDAESSVLSFVRQSHDQKSVLLVILNLTPVLRTDYRVGFPKSGFWKEVINTDAGTYGGGNHGNLGGVWTASEPWHGQPQSAKICLPPLSLMIFKPDATQSAQTNHE
jgi:1,4-alpha-glucan branching enzyme